MDDMAHLRTEHLVKSYGGFRAVAGVSLAVAEGEVHALIGPNGAGKTTLVALLDGSSKADDGRVYLGGHDITDLPQHKRGQLGLGRSYQRSCLIPGFTAVENMMTGLLGMQTRPSLFAHYFRPVFADTAWHKLAMQHLAEVGLEGRGDIPVAELAHGEQRRLELALALLRGSQFLLLDEPMAGVDDTGRKEMTRLVGRLRGKRTILLIEHDMDVVFALADRISVLVGGRVIASNTPQAIARDKRVQQSYLGEAGYA